MANRRHSEQIDINVSARTGDAAGKIREISRSILEAKVLTNQPIRVRMNLRDLENGAKHATGTFRMLAGAIRTFNTLIFANSFNSVIGHIVRTVDGYTNLENKVRSVLTAHEELGFTMERLTSIANANRTSIDSVATVYSRTAKSVEDLGVSQSATLEFTKVLSQAVVVGGSTAIEAQQAMIQLSQGLASGALKGDELRSVLEQLPVVSKILAKELGVTVGALKKLGAEGKITSETVFAAIINAGDEMQDKFDDLVPTFEQSWQVFHNNWIVGLQMFAPMVKALGESLGWLTEKWNMMGDAIEYASGGLLRGREGAVHLTTRAQGDIAVLEHLKGLGFEKSELKDAAEGLSPEERAAIIKAAGIGESKGAKTPWEYAEERRRAKEEEEKDLYEIQKGEAMLDLAALADRPKKPPKTKKEGGLTFAELIEKMRQENEVEALGDYEGGIAKEFFQKMGMLKDSLRETLIAGAGKGGTADSQLQELMAMIRQEHDAKIANDLKDDNRKELLDKAKEQLKVWKEEREAILENARKLKEKDQAIRESVDPYHQYNEEVEKFQDHVNRNRDFYTNHPDELGKITDAVEKLGTMYQTFNPIFENMRTNIADAAAEALVFGKNMADALNQIGKQTASSFISSSLQLGMNALLGVPMPGLTGGNPVVPPGPPNVNPQTGQPLQPGETLVFGEYVRGSPKGGASGGYFPGYAYGGYTGSGGRGDVAGYVHGKEFVVNANATARNRALLESINSGKQVSSNVTVHNYAGVQVETATGSNGEIEVMIRKAIAEQTPGVMAAELGNANSNAAKALRRNYALQRRP